MQRRSFFGVLGGIGAFFGFKTEVAAAPDTDLPIIRFDSNNNIVNLDELFKNSEKFDHDPEGWAGTRLVTEFSTVYLREEDVNLINQFNGGEVVVYYGPFLAERIVYKNPRANIVYFHRLASSLWKETKKQHVAFCGWAGRKDLIIEESLASFKTNPPPSLRSACGFHT